MTTEDPISKERFKTGSYFVRIVGDTMAHSISVSASFSFSTPPLFTPRLPSSYPLRFNAGRTAEKLSLSPRSRRRPFLAVKVNPSSSFSLDTSHQAPRPLVQLDYPLLIRRLRSERTKWGGALSGALASILIGLVASSVGLIPSDAPAYRIVFGYLLPVAVPLLLLGADLRRVVRSTGGLLLAFLIGSGWFGTFCS